MPFNHPTARAIQEALDKVGLDGSWRTYNGPNLDLLRSMLGQLFGRDHVRLCCSGTFGIELAIRSLRLDPSAEVLLAGYDYPGNFRAIEDAGARVALSDVASNDWVPNIDSLAASVGENTRAVVISHLHGSLAPMESICRWAKDNDIFVIEDACQEPGSRMNCETESKLAGSWGDISVFSFGGSKLLSAGRGGAVMTNDSRLSQRMTVYCERGNDAYALSELQAAIVLPQLERLEQDNTLRRDAANRLRNQLQRFEWIDVVEPDEGNQPGFYKIGLRIHSSALESTQVQKLVRDRKHQRNTESDVAFLRNVVTEYLESFSIAVGPGFKGFANRSNSRCRRGASLQHSIAAAEETLVLHHSHLLDPETGVDTVDQVVEAFERIHEEIFG